MQGGTRIVTLLLMAVVLLQGAPARANESVAELTKLVSSSSNDKVRLSAVAALARLGDRRTMKPLVTALHDPNAQVRALAASALGRLGHQAALPSLKQAADDPDAAVRDKAKAAAIAVAKANRLPDPFPVAVATPAPGPTKQVRQSGGRPGFGRQAHAVENHPDLYVMINSSTDDSPGKADQKTRKLNSEILKQSLGEQFTAQPMVTQIAADAQRWGLDPRHIDLSVTKLDVTPSGQFIEIDAQLRLAISDDTGKMLSFLSGGAKVQVPKRTFDAKYLPSLRREALENAMRGMFDKLLAHLRDRSQT